MRPIAWIVSATFVVACGGKVTSVDSSKTVNALTPSDQTQLCNDQYNYVTSSFSQADVAKILCWDSTIFSTDATNCQTEFNDCLAQEINRTARPDCTAFTQQLGECNLSVGDYFDCIGQEIRTDKWMESQMPFCSSSAQLSALKQATSQYSASCLEAACPTVSGTLKSSGTSDGGTDGG